MQKIKIRQNSNSDDDSHIKNLSHESTVNTFSKNKKKTPFITIAIVTLLITLLVLSSSFLKKATVLHVYDFNTEDGDAVTIDGTPVILTKKGQTIKVYGDWMEIKCTNAGDGGFATVGLSNQYGYARLVIRQGETARVPISLKLQGKTIHIPPKS